MQQLEPLKGKNITVPTKVTRYLTAYYTKINGWQLYNVMDMYTTPESALERFLNSYTATNQNEQNPVLYYQIIEIKLDIPL